MKIRPPEIYGIPVKELARLCRVSIKTAGRWKAGQTVPPESALMILRADLGIFDPAWAGWHIQGGTLVSPENWIATPGDVLSIQLTQAQLSAYRTENRHLRAELDAIDVPEEQPLPEAWTVAIG